MATIRFPHNRAYKANSRAEAYIYVLDRLVTQPQLTARQRLVRLVLFNPMVASLLMLLFLGGSSLAITWLGFTFLY